MDAPVFYDPSGRRRRWSKRILLGLIIVLTCVAFGFAATIINVPAPDPLKIGLERQQPRPLKAQVGHLRRRVRAMTAWLPGSSSAAPQRQTIVGFYIWWDDASRASLAAHIGEIDWLVPVVGSVVGPKHDLQITNDRGLRALLASRQHRPAVFPLIQNVRGGVWDGDNIARLLRDPAARKALLDRLEPMLAAQRAAGISFDFEQLPAWAHPFYRRFLREAQARFGPRKLLVTVQVPVDDPDWDLKQYSRVADKLFLMNYDQHYDGSGPGPIAAQPWFVQQLRIALTRIPRDKLIVAIGNYAQDWPVGKANADAMTVQRAWLIAHDNGSAMTFDPASGNATFGYEDDDGTPRRVWLLDAASGWNQLRAIKAAGASGVALWKMGGEDPGIWDDFRAIRVGNMPPAFGKLEPRGNVPDVVGQGEIVRVMETPGDGMRTVTADRNGLIRDEHFAAYPTPYVVARTGYRPGQVALTFDDGPDARWTPKILDILKAKNVPATFFVIGENALAHPFLLNRILDQGSELGNHSYTHPDMSQVSPRGASIELNTTQRLIQAYTGRSMRLVRIPYFGDAEPTTDNELGPVLEAQNAGYLNIGLHVDSEDWQRPGAPAIVANTIRSIEAGEDLDPSADGKSRNIILLHDSGGDRAQTVAALPVLIDALRARGYRFVSVSALAGLSRDQVNPKIGGSDLLAVRFDVSIFLLLAGLDALLKYLFFMAIFLGTARAVLLAALAVRSNLAQNRAVAPEIDPERFVSVLIP
ncbi:MAG TPA: polysaccharide deacetylase family protein, partial [Sphingomonas sp.]|nr:polysaccharide deacetylase family protein [Sphingomonas sp.]